MWGHLLETGVIRIQYKSCYSIQPELLQFLAAFGFSELFLVIFDRHDILFPQLVCECVEELNYMCQTQNEYVLPGLL